MGSDSLNDGILLARFINSNSYYAFFLSTGFLFLYKRVSGIFTLLTTAVPFTRIDDNYYTMKMRVVGSTIIGYIDGVELISGTDSQFVSAGYAGLSRGGTASIVYDEFSVNVADLTTTSTTSTSTSSTSTSSTSTSTSSSTSTTSTSISTSTTSTSTSHSTSTTSVSTSSTSSSTSSTSTILFKGILNLIREKHPEYSQANYL